MDPLSIAMMALGMVNVSLQAAKQLGLIGNNVEAVKYVEAGVTIAGKAIPIVRDAMTNPSKYDAMAPAEIRALLAPATWDEIEARAATELGIETPPRR